MIESIIEQIKALSVEDRRILFRRLRVSGLLEKEVLSTDQNRLQVATAIGENRHIKEDPVVLSSPLEREPHSSSIVSGFENHKPQYTQQHIPQEKQNGAQRTLSFVPNKAPDGSHPVPFETETDQNISKREPSVDEAFSTSDTLSTPAIPERDFIPLAQPQSRQSGGLTNDGSGYRSPVSGKVVVGAPTPEDKTPPEQDDPHAMPPLPGQAPEQPIEIVFDGGSKGNPGVGYGSYQLSWPGIPPQMVRLQFGNWVTNNEAEYDTLIAALETVLQRLDDDGADPSSARLDIRGDSLLVVNQVLGHWRCKSERMETRRDTVRQLLESFGSWRLSHHGRSHSVDVLGH